MATPTPAYMSFGGSDSVLAALDLDKEPMPPVPALGAKESMYRLFPKLAPALGRLAIGAVQVGYASANYAGKLIRRTPVSEKQPRHAWVELNKNTDRPMPVVNSTPRSLGDGLYMSTNSGRQRANSQAGAMEIPDAMFAARHSVPVIENVQLNAAPTPQFQPPANSEMLQLAGRQ